MRLSLCCLSGIVPSAPIHETSGVVNCQALWSPRDSSLGIAEWTCVDVEWMQTACYIVKLCRQGLHTDAQPDLRMTLMLDAGQRMQVKNGAVAKVSALFVCSKREYVDAWAASAGLLMPLHRPLSSDQQTLLHWFGPQTLHQRPLAKLCGLG
jgi:hypothetical protein